MRGVWIGINEQFSCVYLLLQNGSMADSLRRTVTGVAMRYSNNSPVPALPRPPRSWKPRLFAG